MTIEVKICGFTDAEMASTCAEHVNYIGIVRHERSVRHCNLELAGEIASAVVGKARSVVVTVDPTDKEIADIVSLIKPDYIQFHGKESVGRIAQMRKELACGIIKAVPVSQVTDIEEADKFAGSTDFVLLDAKSSNPSVVGGTGQSFDWNVFNYSKPKARYLLAGGLNKANVAAALEISGTTGVDISSGVESRPGIKSIELIWDFLSEVRSFEARKVLQS